MLCRRFRKQKWYTSYLFISTPHLRFGQILCMPKKTKSPSNLDTQKKNKNAGESDPSTIPSHPHLPPTFSGCVSEGWRWRSPVADQKPTSQRNRLGKGGFGLQEIHVMSTSLKKLPTHHSSTGFLYIFIRLMFLMKIWKECDFVHFFLGGG